jgi:hypothetical protein
MNYQIYFPTENSADIKYLKRQGLICKNALIFLFSELLFQGKSYRFGPWTGGLRPWHHGPRVDVLC